MHVHSQGSEGVEVKEGTIGTMIEGNRIYMQKDVESGGEFVCLRRISWCARRAVHVSLVLSSAESFISKQYIRGI